MKIMFCLSWRSHQNPARQETQTTNANRGDVLHQATHCTSNPPSNVQPTHPPKTVLHIDSLGKPSGAYTTHSFEQMRISRFPERLRVRKLQKKQQKLPNETENNMSENLQLPNCNNNITEHVRKSRLLQITLNERMENSQSAFVSEGGGVLRNPSSRVLQPHQD